MSGEVENNNDGPIEEGVLSRLMKKFARLRAVLYVIIPIFGIWLFQRLADSFLNTPVLAAGLWAAALAITLFMKKKSALQWMILLLLALLLYYPLMLMFAKSAVFFVVFVVVAFLAARKRMNAGRPLFSAACIFAAVMFSGIIFTEIFWPVAMVGKPRHVETGPGIRALTSFAASASGKAATARLAGRGPFKLLLSANETRVFAGYQDEGFAGIASVPRFHSAQAVFRKAGKFGLRPLSTNKVTGEVYAADLDGGVIYGLDPEMLRITYRKRIAKREMQAAYVDADRGQILMFDHRERKMNLFNLWDTRQPRMTLTSGNAFYALFPQKGKQLLPGSWSLNDIIAETGSGRYFILYGISRRLVSATIEDARILKIDSSPFPFAADVAADPENRMLYLAKPHGFIEYYDTANLKLMRSMYFKGGVKAISYDLFHDVIVAADYYSGKVSFIDRKSGKTLLKKYISIRISDIVTATDGLSYVACPDGIFEIDPEKLGLRTENLAKK